MKMVCSICKKDLGKKKSDLYPNDAISHGICPDCAKRFMAQMGMPLEEYIENIEVPVVTVTDEGTIGSANRAACRILGRSAAGFSGQKTGDVFECENSALPGGCGNTIHCSGCIIRKTAVDTAHTGNPHWHVPAVLRKKSDAGGQDVNLLISTERVAGVVFLSVDSQETVPASGTPVNSDEGQS